MSKLDIMVDINFKDTAVTLDAKLAKLIKSMKNKKISIGVDQKALSKEFTVLKNKYQKALNSINKTAKIEVNSTNFTATANEIQNALREMGSIKINSKIDVATGATKGFNVELKKANGLIDKMGYELQENGKYMLVSNSILNKQDDIRNSGLAEAVAINHKLEISKMKQLAIDTKATNRTKTQIALIQQELSIKMANLKARYGSLVNLQKMTALQSKLASLTAATGVNVASLRMEYKALEMSAKTSSTALRMANKDAMGLGDAFGQAFTKFPIWIIASTVVMGLVHSIRTGIGSIVEMNEQVTTLKLTMDGTESEFSQLAKSAQDFAKTMGTSVSNVMEAIKVYSNMNQTVDELLDKTKAAIVLSNLTKGSVTEVTDSIQGLLNQFRLTSDESMRVVDSLTRVSASMEKDFASGINEITRGIRVSGASAREAGFSLEQYQAILGNLITTTRLSGSTLGGGLRQIMARLSRATDVDVSIDDISKAETAYKSLGIAIRDIRGEFRDLPYVFDDLYLKWDNLSKVQKSFIAEVSAGTRRKDIFINMMDGWSASLNMYEEALNSSGFAMERNEIYMESFRAKSMELGAVFTIMYQKMISTESINEALDGLIKMAEAFSWLVVEGGALPVTIGLLAGAMTILTKNLNLANSAMNMFGGGLIAVKAKAIATKVAMVALNVSIAGGIAFILSAGIGAILRLANAKKNLEKQSIKVNEAQVDFNSALKDFNDTLDINKINKLSSAYENLRKSLDYEEIQNKIRELKERYEYFKNEAEKAIDWRSMNDLKKLANNAKESIIKLEASVKKVTDAEIEYNKAKSIAEGIDIQRHISSMRAIADDAIQHDKKVKLAEAYQLVAEKIKNGQELTIEEINLNKQLIRQHPGYIVMLNEKAGLMGINSDALLANVLGTKESMKIDFLAAQQSAKNAKMKTDIAIEETKRRLEAMKIEKEAMMNAQSLDEIIARSNNFSVKRHLDLTLTLDRLKAKSKEAGNFINLSFEDLMRAQRKTSIPLIGAGDTSGTEVKYSKLKDTFLEVKETLESINHEIDKQNILLDQAEDYMKPSIISEINRLYKEKQGKLKELNKIRQVEIDSIKNLIEDYVEFDKANRNIIKISRKLNDEEISLVKTYQDLTDAQNKTILSIMELDSKKHSNMETTKELINTEEELKETYENISNKFDRFVDAMEDKYKRDFENFKASSDARIRAIDDEIQTIKRKFDDDEFIKDQENLVKQISKLEKEKAMLAVDNSLWAKQRINAIDSEILSIKEQKDENARQNAHELELRVLSDKKDAINEDVRLEKERLDEKLRLQTANEKIKNMMIDGKYAELINLLQKYDDDFATMGLKHGQSYADQFTSQLRGLQSSFSSFFGGQMKSQIENWDNASSISKPAGLSMMSDSSFMQYGKLKREATKIANVHGWGDSRIKGAGGLSSQAQAIRDKYGITSDDYSYEDLIKYLRPHIPGFETGGEVSYTGLAQVHGTKDNPEWMLSSEQFKLTRTLFNNIKSALPSIGKSVGDIIVNAPLSIQATLENEGYDFDRFGNMFVRNIKDGLQSVGVEI